MSEQLQEGIADTMFALAKGASHNSAGSYFEGVRMAPDLKDAIRRKF
jgi:hypothetical protein